MNMIKAIFDWGDGLKVPCYIVGITDKGECVAFRDDNGTAIIRSAAYFKVIEPAKQYHGDKV